jgi:hypothetical protein
MQFSRFVATESASRKNGSGHIPIRETYRDLAQNRIRVNVNKC